MDLKQFSSIEMSDELQRSIKELGFDVATSIQSQAIPVISQGKDVIGLSQTGSGKTAAFGLPAIDIIDEQANPRITQVLIICPTRELAMQSCIEFKKFAKYKKGIKIVPVFGGDSIVKQLKELRNGCHIVIGTPGRIMDHMRRHTLVLKNLKMVVLDEADEMLKMGFLEDIETILSSSPEDRQTLLFSATMSKEILNIVNNFQKKPITIKIEAKQRTVSTITQNYCVSPKGKKNQTLYSLMEFYKPTSAIVFCNTKKMVDELVDNLNVSGYSAMGIHGDMKQNQRTEVINKYKNHRFPILVATDVVARGIDINDVDYVINYDLPQENEYYIHRIGRTGRAGKKGTAISIVQSPNQLHQLMMIAAYAKCNIEKLAIPTKKEILSNNNDIMCSEIREFISKENIDKYQSAVTSLINDGLSAEELAAALFGLLMKEKNSYEDTAEDVGSMRVGDFEREFSKKKVRVPSKNNSSKKDKKYFDRKNYDNSNMATVKITIGKRDKVAPNHILGAAAGETGLAGTVFGAINIGDKITTIDVPKQYKTKLIESLNNSKIKGIKVKAFSV